MKIVYQTNQDGVYVGWLYADESPLEPGVWLIPGGCVEIAPPDFNSLTQYVQWDGGAWHVHDKPTPPDPEEPEPEEPVYPTELFVQDVGTGQPVKVVIKNGQVYVGDLNDAPPS